MFMAFSGDKFKYGMAGDDMVGAAAKTRIWFAIYMATLGLPFFIWLLNFVGVSPDVVLSTMILIVVAAVPTEIAAFFILRRVGIMPALRWGMLAQLVLLAAVFGLHSIWVLVASAAIGLACFFLSWYAVAVNRGEYYSAATYFGGLAAYMASAASVLVADLAHAFASKL